MALEDYISVSLHFDHDVTSSLMEVVVKQRQLLTFIKLNISFHHFYDKVVNHPCSGGIKTLLANELMCDFLLSITVCVEVQSVS